MYIARKPTPVILLERYVVVKNKERMSHVSRHRSDKWLDDGGWHSASPYHSILGKGGQYVLQRVRKVLLIGRALGIPLT